MCWPDGEDEVDSFFDFMLPVHSSIVMRTSSVGGFVKFLYVICAKKSFISCVHWAGGSNVPLRMASVSGAGVQGGIILSRGAFVNGVPSALFISLIACA